MENKKLISLKNRSDFERLKTQAQVLRASPWLLIVYLKNDNRGMRFAWTVPRAVGSAVIRNRLKRWCRKLARELLLEGVNLDVNFVWRSNKTKSFKDMEYKEFENTVRKAWQKIV